MGLKDGDFVFWPTLEPMLTIRLKFTYLNEHFLGHCMLYIMNIPLPHGTTVGNIFVNLGQSFRMILYLSPDVIIVIFYLEF